MSLFGKDATGFSHLDLGILCHSSLQILSSSVRLDGKRWWTAIFRSLQRCSIGFKSGLWLGHSRQSQSFVKPLLRYFSCVLRVIVLLEGKPSAQSEVLSTLEKVFVQDIPVLGRIHLSLDCNQSSCPCSWKHTPQHDAATTMLHCWDCIGQVMSSAWFSLHTYRLELRPKSSILVSSDQRILQVFLANSMRAFMCLALRRGFRRATLP